MQFSSAYSLSRNSHTLHLPPNRMLFEFFVFKTRDKIIDKLVATLFKVIQEQPQQALTPKKIAWTLISHYLAVSKNIPLNSLERRERCFVAYVVKQVKQSLYAPMPSHVRLEILKEMASYREIGIECEAFQPARQLFAYLDSTDKRLVDEMIEFEK